MERILRIVLSFSLVIFFSCKKKEESVDLQNDAAVTSLEISIGDFSSDKDIIDLGKFLTGGDPEILIINIKNPNTKYEARDLKAGFTSPSNQFYFYPNDDGEKEYPGGGGTCGNVLEKESECSIVIVYDPKRSGEVSNSINVQYKNLLGPKSETFQFKAYSGLPASLFFTSEVTAYDFGIVEKTEPVMRYQNLELKNGGELPAQNINFNLLSADDDVFEIKDNNCPSVLRQGESCELKVAYTPRNNDVSDPAKNYSANLTIDYTKDSEGRVASLSASFSSLSTSIEGDFRVNGLSTIEFNELVVGNLETNKLKIVNKGYKEGVIKKVIFKKSDDSFWAKCSGPELPSGYLNCKDDDDNVLSLEDFPFKLTDVSECVNEEAYGQSINGPGKTCNFDITFHPSVNYLSDENFDGTKVFVHYDSRWKNNETLYTKEMFTINAKSKAAAILTFEEVTYDSSSLAVTNNMDGTFDSDLGRVTLVSSSAYEKSLVFKVSNIGNAVATFTSIKDAQTPPKEIGEVPVNLNSYYKGAVHSNCTSLEPGSFCLVSMNISPVASNQTAENANMFDEITNAAAGEGKKHFDINYHNGANYLDDESNISDKEIRLSLFSKLVRKGFLVYHDDMLPMNSGGNLGRGITGSSDFPKKLKLRLENAGTGGIPYINLLATYAPLDSSNYGVKYIAEAPSSADRDCYPLLHKSNSLFSPSTPAPADPPLGYLGAGETCELTLIVDEKVYSDVARSSLVGTGDIDKFVNYTSLGVGSGLELEYLREFVVSNNNTLEAWEGRGKTFDLRVDFEYYDGDDYIGSDIDNYGDRHSIENLDQNYIVRAQAVSAAKLIPEDPTPFASAIFYRQAISLPALNLPSYLVNVSQAELANSSVSSGSSASAVSWFYGKYIGGSDVVYAGNSLPVISSRQNDSYEYTLHVGTFPVGVTQNIRFNIVNHGGSDGVVNSLTWENATASPLTLLSGEISSNTSVGSGETHALEIRFSPVGVGTFERVLEITYDNGAETITKKIQVVGEAISSYADIEVDIKDYSVIYDPITENTSENLETGVSQTILSSNILYNKTNPTPSEHIIFTGVKTSPVYAKRRVIIKNTSGSLLENLDINMLEDNGLTVSNTTVDKSLTNIDCGSSIAASSSCAVEVKFQAFSSSGDSESMILNIAYEIASNQYVSRQVPLSFIAEAPADLSIAGMTKESVSDAGAGGLIRNSYLVDFGGYGDPNHIKLNTFPKTVETGCNGCDIEINVVNSSTLKASFLRMIDAYYGGVVPGGSEVEIYNNNAGAGEDTIKVFAKRGCLFGDDEFDGGVPSEQKGFNSNVSVGNDCYLRVQYGVKGQYLDDYEINKNNHVIPLEYYNNARNSYEVLYIHLSGFLEPNRVSLDLGDPESDYFAVETYDDGSVSLSWPRLVENTLAWGNFTNYKVYYTTNPTELSNIYETTANYVNTGNEYYDFSPGTFSTATFYYFKVVAERNYGGKTYVSEGPLSILEVVVPPGGVSYIHDDKILVDKDLLDFSGYYKLDAIDACRDYDYGLLKQGSLVQYRKELISSVAWEYIRLDEDLSDYSSGNSPIYYPHWLGDSAYDIESVLTAKGLIGGYDPNLVSQVFSSDSLIFKKICTGTPGCNMLSKVAGGDGVDLYVDGEYYVDEDDFEGFARCFYELP